MHSSHQPPSCRRRADDHIIARPQPGKPGIAKPERLAELAFEDDDDVADPVVVMAEERLGVLVAHEEAGRVAAAVEAGVEGIEPRLRPGEKLLGAALGQVVFAEAEELAADAATAMGRMDEDGADYALGLRAVGRPATAGVAEADDLVPFLGEDEAGGIEVGLGKNVAFEKHRGTKLHGAAAKRRRVPEVHQQGRVGVAEISILDHEAPAGCRTVDRRAGLRTL